MPLKNGNTVGVERRMDLASLFCMIGRHGPAVALAVIAIVSVLAGFVIYRTVRGKRRKAPAADGDGKSPGEERDAAGVQEQSPEEARSCVQSTDASDEVLSEMKEDVGLIQSDLKVRHRRSAAAEHTSSPYPHLKSETQVPDNKHTTSDDAEEVAVVWDSYQVSEAYAEEASKSQQSGTYTEAELVLEDAVDRQDVLEELHYNESCLNKTETIKDENNEEEEKVLKSEDQEDEGLSADEDVSDKQTREETDNFLCAFISPVCFEETRHMSENSDEDKDNETTNDVEDSEEPTIHTEDVPDPCVCYDNEEFEEEEPESIDCNSYSTDNNFSPDEGNGCEEAEEECLKDEGHDDSLSGMTTDQPNAQISGIEGSIDFSSDCPQREYKTASSLDEDTDITIICPHISSQETGNQHENFQNGTAVALVEEGDDQVYESHVQSCYEDIENIQMIRNEALDEASVSDEPDVVASDGENIATPEDIQKAADTDTFENDTDSVIVEEIVCPQLRPICQEQQSDHVETNENVNETRVDDPDACKNASCTAPVMSEDISCPVMLSSSHDQQNDHMENNVTLDKITVQSDIDAPACDHSTTTSLIMPMEPSHPDMLSSSQDQQSDQQIIPEDTTGAASVMTEDNKPPICQIRLPSFEQFEMRDNDPSLVGSAGVESGISSMAVSPDAGNDFDVIFEHTVLPMMDCYLKSDWQMEAQKILFADDAATSSIEDDTAGMVFQPFPSHHSQQPHSEQTSWTDYESLAANNDMSGHEIEESYHRAIDQFAAEIANSVTSFVEELEKQSGVKVVEVVVIKEQKAGVSVEKKEETKAEKEKEEDYEKTEISIMEATMDHNEWIMDGNYQTLPWMNLSALSIPQDLTKTNELPTEESQNSLASMDTTCVDPSEIPPSTDVQQTSTLSLINDNTENNKKVVAVQPMPKNVNVTFHVHYITQSPSQTVAVTGNQQELGNWKEFIPLERAKDGHWATVISLPAESHAEWKFVVVDKGEVCRWEEGGNRHLDTGYGDDLLVHQRWGLF
ncbi:uncharacterized protein [Notothenia coriiceps]|uniref:Starch-binding domain-containing protein 1 n=1 Tax=Notothenia coriiceps TaxID=8208 RepID=A0A6I9PVF2_9TELE|nr:PREDICTED: starch-binding domain-containing protein 1 [Notothenia coriiceps]